MPVSRFAVAAAAGAFAGLAAITAYLAIERAVADHLPAGFCLMQLLQWDASNAYGDAAFTGGWPVAGVGLAMDAVVSLIWGAIFTTLYLRAPAVRANLVVSGLVFGAIVMVVMLFAVVPLGHAIRMHDTAGHLVNVLVAHTVFFGLPLALAVRATAGRPAAMGRAPS